MSWSCPWGDQENTNAEPGGKRDFERLDVGLRGKLGDREQGF